MIELLYTIKSAVQPIIPTLLLGLAGVIFYIGIFWMLPIDLALIDAREYKLAPTHDHSKCSMFSFECFWDITYHSSTNTKKAMKILVFHSVGILMGFFMFMLF